MLKNIYGTYLKCIYKAHFCLSVLHSSNDTYPFFHTITHTFTDQTLGTTTGSSTVMPDQWSGITLCPDRSLTTRSRFWSNAAVLTNTESKLHTVCLITRFLHALCKRYIANLITSRTRVITGILVAHVASCNHAACRFVFQNCLQSARCVLGFCFLNETKEPDLTFMDPPMGATHYIQHCCASIDQSSIKIKNDTFKNNKKTNAREICSLEKKSQKVNSDFIAEDHKY